MNQESSIFDLEALERTELQHDPCDFRKKLTTLINFNAEWNHANGRQRLLHSSWSLPVGMKRQLKRLLKLRSRWLTARRS